MKKYVLNIERLYTGETANALVLNQVDDELPVLLPSMPETERSVSAWIGKCQEINPDFKPNPEWTRERLNEYIIEFNLGLQAKFKGRGHDELYLMDDTQWMNPSTNYETFTSDKVNMHLLNGRTEQDVNSSQLNVIFPFKKVSSKSLYAEQLAVESPYELDGKMESSRQMSLQGKVTSENCLQGSATVGGNLYVMSPLVESMVPEGNLIANGMTIVNSFLDKPYHFPHTMTLFQPSRDRYDDPNLAKDDNGFTPFKSWYEKYNRRTVVSTQLEYGGNTSHFTCLGAGSYEIELATHSPTDLVLVGTDTVDVPLNVDTFRKIRDEKDEDNKYEAFEDEAGNKTYKYVFDNSIVDDKEKFADVGFKFNLYDNFITGDERILHMVVPKDTDFNKLFLRFTCKVDHAEMLLGNYEYIVFVGDEEKYRLSYDGKKEVEFVDGEEMEKAVRSREVEVSISDAVLKSHEYDIRVIAHYQVDFTRRNNESDYRRFLKSSGLALMDIRVDNDVIPTKRQLTFADYVNDVGISETERARRLFQFWQVSQYKRDIPYQLVLETSLRNTTSAGIAYPNNYSTGDIYGDVFATKSILNSIYDMDIKLNDEKTILSAKGRDYLNIGQCSSQLFLVFKPTKVEMEYGTDNDNSSPIATPIPMPERDDGGNYQLVEVVKNVNRFESSIKHKPNVFSVVVQNSNLAEDPTVDMTDTESDEYKLEKYKESLRNSVTQFVRNTCEGIVPAHTQLFDVQFK